MTLTAKEESFVQSLRRLPEEAADQVMEWTRRLSDLAHGRTVEWSDAWTEDDVRDATAASIRNLERQERKEH
jgi:hypothetical protein